MSRSRASRSRRSRHYAERFADAGYTVLAFDASGFGESGGEPRFHYDPWRLISDDVDAGLYL